MRPPERNSLMAKILIAEDNEDIRSLVVRALSDDGHELTATADGDAALDEITRHHGGFDLVLSDVKMPVMDGIALALAVGKDHPEIPIMLMTGYADQRERTRGLDALVHDIIAKPFSLDQIKCAVREALIARH
jgi:two-component system cell cycle response regulator CpdR